MSESLKHRLAWDAAHDLLAELGVREEYQAAFAKVYGHMKKLLDDYDVELLAMERRLRPIQ